MSRQPEDKVGFITDPTNALTMPKLKASRATESYSLSICYCPNYDGPVDGTAEPCDEARRDSLSAFRSNAAARSASARSRPVREEQAEHGPSIGRAIHFGRCRGVYIRGIQQSSSGVRRGVVQVLTATRSLEWAFSECKELEWSMADLPWPRFCMALGVWNRTWTVLHGGSSLTRPRRSAGSL